MSSCPYLSIVVPVYEEEESLAPFTQELVEVLECIERPYEIIFVDDGSTDATPRILAGLKREFRNINIIRFKQNCGQTAAFDAGFKAAQGDIIITMDADLQNDPHDIPAMLPFLADYDLVCGWRYKRNDNFIRKISSRIANAVRNMVSGEDIKDVGCSLKAFKCSHAKQLKLYTGMHRFFPTLVKMEGGTVKEIKVNHRPRSFGMSKYNVMNRVFKSFVDLLAVCWMKKRYVRYEIESGCAGTAEENVQTRIQLQSFHVYKKTA
jgi:glycosyltransferase involved in cell wall biosynthesis